MLSTDRENLQKKSVFSFLSDSKNSNGYNDSKAVQENANFWELQEKGEALHIEESCPSGFRQQLTSSVACKVSNSAWALGQKRVKTRRALLGNLARETQMSNTGEDNFISSSNSLTPSCLKESTYISNASTDVLFDKSTFEANGNNVGNSVGSLQRSNINSSIQKDSMGCNSDSRGLPLENSFRNELSSDIKLQLESLSNVNSPICSVHVSNETVSSISSPCLDGNNKETDSLTNIKHMSKGLSLLTGVDDFLVLKKDQLDKLTNLCRCEENVFDVTFHRQCLLDEVNQLKTDQNEAILREDYVEADIIDQLIMQTKKKLEDFEETTCSSPFAFFVKIEEAFNEKYVESANMIQNVLNEFDTIQHTIIEEMTQKITPFKSVMEKDIKNLFRDLSQVEEDYAKIKIQKEDISIQQEQLKKRILKRTFVYEGTREKAVTKKSQLDREIEDLECILDQKREFRRHLKSIIVKNEMEIKKIENDFKVELCEIQSKQNKLDNEYKRVEYERKRLVAERGLLEKQTKTFTKNVKEMTLQMGLMIITRQLLRQYIIFSLNQVKPLRNALISLARSFTNISTGCQSLSQVRHTISSARQKIESYLSIVNDLKMKQLNLQNQLDQFLKQKDQAVQLRQFRDAASFTKEIQRVTFEMESLVSQVASNEKDLNDASLTIQNLEPEENKLRDAINHLMCFAGDSIFHLLQMYRKSIGSIVNPVEQQTSSQCNNTCLPFDVLLEKSVDDYLQMVENSIHQMALQKKSKFLSPPILVQHIAKNLKREFFQHSLIQVTQKILHSFFSLFCIERIVCDSLLMTCLKWTTYGKSNDRDLKLEESSLKKMEENKRKLAFLYLCKSRQDLVEFNPFGPSNANNFLNDMSHIAECVIAVREIKNLFLTFALSNKEKQTSVIAQENTTQVDGFLSNKLRRSHSFSCSTLYRLSTHSSDGSNSQFPRHPSAMLFSKTSPNNVFSSFLDQEANNLMDGVKICKKSSGSKLRSLSI